MSMRAWFAVAVVLVAAGCGGGGGGTPTAPSTGTSGPGSLQITQQQVSLTANIVTFSWSGSGPVRVLIGTSPLSQNVHTADVTGTTYTWTGPREANAYYVRVAAVTNGQVGSASNEVLVYTIDMRHVIDAMYFRSGPMSDAPSAIPGNPVAGVWADGTRLQVPIAQELGQATRAFADRFLDDYAAITGGAITATSVLSADDFRTITLGQVPEFSIPTRVSQTFCSAGALACAYYGPAPLGQNRSIVTMVSASAGALRAMAHELGHAYGMGHVRVTASVRAELNFMMNPTLVSDFMTETEKAAIAAARAGGLRAGWNRNQALAAGLVAPISAGEAIRVASLLNNGSTTDDKCRIGAPVS